MRHAPSAVLVMRIVADTNTALSGLLWLKTCPSERSKRSRSPGSAPSIRRSDKASALARPTGAANLGGAPHLGALPRFWLRGLCRRGRMSTRCTAEREKYS